MTVADSNSRLNDCLSELTRDLPEGAILTDPSGLFVYEADGFTIARARPAAVVFPVSVDQVVRVVQTLAKFDIQIVPRGSGTGLTGGCVAFNHGVIVSTVKLNRVLSIDLDNRVAHVQAGCRNIQLSEAVASTISPSGIVGAGYHFSPDPSSQRVSTVGGNAATNAGGIHILKDFASSNHVLGIEMVLSDGSLIEVGAKNGAYESGFDLPGLVCGSEGTFGIITSLWVRLVPKPTSFRTAVATFHSPADACHTVSEIIAAGIMPAAMEMMDGVMIQAVESAFKLGFPPEAQALLLIEIDGIDDLLDATLATIETMCRTNHVQRFDASKDPARRAELWKARKSAFAALGRVTPSYCTQDACVPRSRLAEVLTRISEIGKEFGLTIPSAFHAGDGNIHPVFLYDDRDESQVQNTLLAAEKVLEYCIEIGGTISGEHGIGVEKIALMPLLFDAPTMSQFQRVKHAFDPDEHINAGKLMPSDKVVVQLLKPGRHSPQ